MRRVMTIAILLGIGMNYLVAWACLSWTPTRDLDCRGHEFRYPTSDFGPLYPGGCRRRDGIGKSIHTESYDRDNGIQTSGWVNTHLPIVRAGWPALSVSSEARLAVDDTLPPRHSGPYWEYDRSWPAALAWGLPTGQLGRWLGVHHRVPIVPLWPGFLLNTLVYATLALACIALAHRIKRQSHTRRGLCTNCGYTLTSLQTCPECGTPNPRTIPQ